MAVARAFAAGARVLFADEPTGNLDRKNGATIGELLFALNASYGSTLMLVTHGETARHPLCALKGGGSSVRRIRAHTAPDPNEHHPSSVAP